MNVSNCYYLESLDIENNKVEKITFENNFKLKSILAANNQLRDLNITELSALENLDLDSNMISSLDAIKNIRLKNIYLNENKLKLLKISSVNIDGISFYNNPLKSICIDPNIKKKIISSLKENNIKDCKIITTCNFKTVEPNEDEIFRTTIKSK